MPPPATPSDSLFDDAPVPGTPSPGQAGVAPAWLDESLFKLGRQLPANVYLGTSSWSFPGWQDIVYSRQYTESQLARHGLAAYSQHPVLRAVGIEPVSGSSPEDARRFIEQEQARWRPVVEAAGVKIE